MTPSRILHRGILATTSFTRTLQGNTSRVYSSSSSLSPFKTGPAPPRLPKEDQEIFEELQRQSTGAFSTPRTPPKVNQSPDSHQQGEVRTETNRTEGEAGDADGNGGMHPNLRVGVKPEFEGEKNPKTGEIGGPKNEPLRWGAEGDWSYAGRVTDF